jgi:aryl-alcohol dehydrogenase-like predicted oxidoreductase
VKRFDLAQVYNFLDWETHLATLQQMKADGRLRYVGVTTSHGRRHDLAEKIMRGEKIDFIQFTYNLNDREAEARLLPTAAERGIAVIVNHPFDGGGLFGAKTAKPLPGWGAEIGCATWAEVFLKFVVSHPAVTYAIPATSQLAHLRENMRALAGPLPDEPLRRRIAADYTRA